MTTKNHTVDKDRYPAFFLGHGNPMNALDDNRYSRAWAAIGREFPAPRAALVVSAHWYVPGVHVTSMPQPRTIHDFGGFPQALFDMQYPAPGDPQLADEIIELLAPENVGRDFDWGLDHGTWAVLCHVWPNANVPVVQLSIDRRQAPEFHYELGSRLAPLRDEGVLVIGSGNVVHNLARYAWNDSAAAPFDWNVRFDATVRKLLESRRHRELVDYASLGQDAALAVPTPDHYLPLLYVAALQTGDDAVSYPVDGFDGASMSMLSIRIG